MTNPRWWRYLGLILDRMESDDLVDNSRDTLTVLSAWLSNSKMPSDALKKVEATVHGLLGRILNSTHPWLGRSEEERTAEMHEHFRAVYNRLIGDPDDPQVKAAIAREAAAYRERRDSQAFIASPDVELDQRIRARAKAAQKRRR